MHHHIRRRPLTVALRRATLLLGLLPALAWAEPKVFDIAPQPLGSALNRLAEQSGLQVIYNGELVHGLSSPGVSGSQEPEAALQRLLQGSGLTWRSTGAGSVVLEAQPKESGAINLAPSSIVGQVSAGAMTEGTGSYTTPAVTIGKGERSIRETPQSVTVLTSQRLKDQDIKTLDDVYKVTPGIVAYGALLGDNQPYSRGFEIDNFQINGIPLPTGNAMNSLYWSDLISYDRVEVLKGSAGLFQGAGSPGGAINLVRKRASSDFKFSTTTQAGSWDNYRQEIDIQGALNDTGSVRGRLATSYGTRHYFYDRGESERASTYGVLEFDITPNTVISTGFTYQNVENRSTMDWGMPGYRDGSKIDFKRSVNLSSPGDYNDVESTQFFVDGKHQFNEDWSFSLTSNYTKLDLDSLYSQTGGPIDPVTRSGGYNWGEARQENNYQYNTDMYVRGHFDLFQRRHEVILGSNVSHAKRSASRFETEYFPAYDNIPDILDFRAPTYTRQQLYRTIKSTLDQQGVYSSLRLNVSDPLDIIIGARASWWRYAQDQRNAYSGVVTATGQETNAKVVPFYGAVYELDEHWSAYASYAQIFTPQTDYMTYAGNTLAPRSGETYELGLKGEFYEGALNATFAVFRSNYSGRAQEDKAYPSPCNSPATVRCYIAGGKVRAEGFETEVSGQVLPGLDLSAGYTFNRSEYVSNPDDVSLEGRTFLTQMPKHLLRVWANYRLPETLSRWQIGLGTTMQSGVYNLGSGVKNEGAGYALYSARVGYDLSENVSLSLNVENLFDKHYYVQTGTVTGNSYYGTPREMTFTLRTSF